MFWSEQPFVVSIHHGARLRHLARARLRRMLLDETARGVAGAHPPLGPDHLRHVEPGCALVGTRRALQQPPRKTQDTPPLVVPCLRCGSFLQHKSVAAAAASSLMRFSPNPSCRGDAANPWLGSAFITHVGCLSRHLFVCSQSIAIACVSRRVSPLLVYFRKVSPLLVYFRRVSPLLVYFRRVSSLLCVSAEFELPADSRWTCLVSGSECLRH